MAQNSSPLQGCLLFSSTMLVLLFLERRCALLPPGDTLVLSYFPGGTLPFLKKKFYW
jgi:hypothetical protein